MMLFKLSARNLRKSLKDYMIYFVTLIIGVAVFYIFNAMDDQTVLLKVSESTNSVIRLMNNMLSAISVFVSFVLGFLIVYASNFLLKRRKKEFGIYMILGMGKRQISKILFFETMLIGLISLAVGLFTGVILSQGMSVVIANLFDADMTDFTFILSKKAVLKTILYFLVMYVFVLLMNTFVVGKAKLIDLLNASKKTERIRVRNPWICAGAFLFASVILADAYYNVTTNAEMLTSEWDILFQIAKGIVGTFLIFWSLSGLLLMLAKKNKKLYYKKVHMFTVRELASRIHTTVISGSIICLMLFVTICVLSSATSAKKSIEDNLENMTPVDVNFVHSTDSEGLSWKMPRIADVLDQVGVDRKQFKDVVELDSYSSAELTFAVSIGEAMKELEETSNQDFLDYLKEQREEVIRLSDYNQVADLYRLKKLKLAENEYAVVCNFESYMDIRNMGLKKHTPLLIGGKKYQPRYETCQDGFLSITSNHTNSGFIVVPDSADLSEFGFCRNYYLANYANLIKKEREKLDAYLGSREFDEKLNSNTEESLWPTVRVETKTAIYDNSIGLTALMIFIGMYLGIIFMISGAAILALKELSEASDSREKYQILRRIGVDEKMIRGSLFRQCLLFFAMPLVLAMIHSIFGIQVSNMIFESFGRTGLLFSILITALVILGIYGVYFLITYFCSRRIISE
ncbi:MAG: ABC transporter permease [Lachnospiraceae bacterium]|nr:ABC transporter permease [Lachnospiraceae bacterium]